MGANSWCVKLLICQGTGAVTCAARVLALRYGMRQCFGVASASILGWNVGRGISRHFGHPRSPGISLADNTPRCYLQWARAGTNLNHAEVRCGYW